MAAPEFPRVGWRRGLFVVGVYAPTSAAPHRERESLRRQTGEVLGRAPGSMMRLVVGDFNAESGLSNRGGWEDVLGPHGLPRRSQPGAEWLEWRRSKVVYFPKGSEELGGTLDLARNMF